MLCWFLVYSNVIQLERERGRERAGRERQYYRVSEFPVRSVGPYCYLFYILEHVSVNPTLLSYSSLPLPSQPQSVLCVCQSASVL